MSTARHLRSGIFLAVVLTAALLPSGAQGAAIINVTTNADEFDSTGTGAGCSLREAVQAANTDAPFGGCPRGNGADSIVLKATTYILSRTPASTSNATGDLNVHHSVTIVGKGTGATTINGHATDRILAADNNASVTMRRMTLTNGNAADPGGAIQQLLGKLILTNVVISGNGADGAGGGVYVFQGDATLRRVVLSGNHTQGDGGALAIYTKSSALLTIDESTITANTATIRGAGIYVGGLTTLMLRRSLITLNHGDDGDGLSVDGTATVRNSTITGNGNSVEGGQGGGIYNAGNTKLQNVTISGNLASFSGGDGGNIYNTGTLSAKNTIVNEALSSGNCGGTAPISLGHNLDWATGSSQPCFSTFGDPKLGPLANNGGPTMTQAIGPGSAAVNAGETVLPITTDQRGAPRPAGPKPDIGAYERSFCHGVLVDRVGTDSGETINGTGGPDGILGRGGNDIINGGGGNDGLCGGAGNDRLLGGPGNDNLDGGPGIDTCIQGPGTGIRVSCEH